MLRSAPNFIQFDAFAIAGDEAMEKGGNAEQCWLAGDAEAAQREPAQKTAVTVPLREMPFGNVFAVSGSAGGPRFVLELAKHRHGQSEWPACQSACVGAP